MTVATGGTLKLNYHVGQTMFLEVHFLSGCGALKSVGMGWWLGGADGTLTLVAFRSVGPVLLTKALSRTAPLGQKDQRVPLSPALPLNRRQVPKLRGASTSNYQGTKTVIISPVWTRGRTGKGTIQIASWLTSLT